MLEAFFLKDHPERVEGHWRQKTLVTCEIMGRSALRFMRPEIIGDRTRVDLMWNGKTLGIRGPSKDDGTYTFWAITKPDTVSKGIAAMLIEFSADPPPLELAQLRFREGHDGIFGIWIDTSNEHIRDLLAETQWLKRCLDRKWVIEIGQKKKEVEWDAATQAPVLKRAEARVWLPSYDRDNQEILLKSYMSLFSQPGPETNRALIAAGFDLLDLADVKELPWAEWGAGYGNLTAAYVSRLGIEASASELEPPSAELLVQNMLDLGVPVRCEQRIAEKGPTEFEKKAELWLIDPPRPGFGMLLETLKTAAHPPRYVLAYHCHAKGLIQDTRILREANYKLLNWSSVDAFPATPHHEVISLWQKV